MAKKGADMAKIGMCCDCGYDFPKSKTVLHGDFEYCFSCADMSGIDYEERDQRVGGVGDPNDENDVDEDFIRCSCGNKVDITEQFCDQCFQEP